MRGLIVILAAMLCTPALAAGNGEKLITKIDTIIATAHRGIVVIEARGAVPSGGWKNAKLRVVRVPADPHALVVDFVAVPPPANAPVIQGLVPVSANATVALRKGVASVRAVTSVNEITTQILK